jgi:hydroxyacylglutathione hydrolase
VLLERATHPQFVSNTYVLAAAPRGPAIFIDAGGPVEPLLAVAERERLEPTHLLLTHHHFDHVSETPSLRERWPELEVMASPQSSSSAGWRSAPCPPPATRAGC